MNEDANKWLIWDATRRMWWRDHGEGYTSVLASAGCFSRTEAMWTCTQHGHHLNYLALLPVCEDVAVQLAKARDKRAAELRKAGAL